MISFSCAADSVVYRLSTYSRSRREGFGSLFSAYVTRVCVDLSALLFSVVSRDAPRHMGIWGFGEVFLSQQGTKLRIDRTAAALLESLQLYIAYRRSLDAYSAATGYARRYISNNVDSWLRMADGGIARNGWHVDVHLSLLGTLSLPVLLSVYRSMHVSIYSTSFFFCCLQNKRTPT